MIVTGFFKNNTNWNVYGLTDYKIKICADGKTIACAVFNMNYFIPANGWYKTTLTFPKDTTTIVDLTKTKRHQIIEDGYIWQ